MTSKQTANELFFKYYDIIKRTLSLDHVIISKKCALIAVDEVLKYSKAHGFIGLTEEYEQIKQEIEKL